MPEGNEWSSWIAQEWNGLLVDRDHKMYNAVAWTTMSARIWWLDLIWDLHSIQCQIMVLDLVLVGWIRWLPMRLKFIWLSLLGTRRWSKQKLWNVLTRSSRNFERGSAAKKLWNRYNRHTCQESAWFTMICGSMIWYYYIQISERLFTYRTHYYTT